MVNDRSKQMKDSQRSLGDNLALGAAGLGVASPFAGLIGQKKIVSDPHSNLNIERMTPEKIQELARPGDVVVSSRPGAEGFKITQSPFSGSEFFHTTPVVTSTYEGGMGLDAGDFPELNGLKPHTQYVENKARPLAQHFGEHGYEDMVLMRPNSEITYEQRKDLLKAIAERQPKAYSAPLGIKAMAKDLFLPKLKNAKSEDVIKALEKSCKGDATMCSNFAAEAASHAGIANNIARGKLPTDILPADFLREGSGYSPVGAVVGQRRFYNNIGRKVGPYASRLGIGLGIGGGIYGTYKNPDVAAGIAAGAVAPHIVRKLLGKKYEQELSSRVPSVAAREARLTAQEKLPSLVHTLMSYKGQLPGVKQDITRLLTRTAPLALGVGGAAYLGAHKLRKMFNKESSMKSTNQIVKDILTKTSAELPPLLPMLVDGLESYVTYKARHLKAGEKPKIKEAVIEKRATKTSAEIVYDLLNT
jgi:hypothetical protein